MEYRVCGFVHAVFGLSICRKVSIGTHEHLSPEENDQRACGRYPTDNCAVVFPNPDNPPHDPLQELPQYLTHQAGIDIVQAYLNSTMLAQTWNKPFLMFETNTASCGGFPGISDTFTSALWGLDYALQMANSNFTGALFHFGGQNVSYNVCGFVDTRIYRH